MSDTRPLESGFVMHTAKPNDRPPIIFPIRNGHKLQGKVHAISNRVSSPLRSSDLLSEHTSFACKALLRKQGNVFKELKHLRDPQFVRSSISQRSEIPPQHEIVRATDSESPSSELLQAKSCLELGVYLCPNSISVDRDCKYQVSRSEILSRIEFQAENCG